MKGRGINRISLVTREQFESYETRKMFRSKPQNDNLNNIRLGVIFLYPQQKYGVLKDGRGVYCEVNERRDKIAKKLLEEDTVLLEAVCT